MKPLHWIALILVIVGAINWGLVGLFEFNLVTAIFGDGSVLSRIVFVLVGLAGIIIAATSAAFTSGAGHHQSHHAPSPSP